MLSFTPLQEGLITLPTNFATLIEIKVDLATGEKTYVYQFDVIIDVDSIATQNAWLARVKLLRDPVMTPSLDPMAFSPSIFGSVTKNLEATTHLFQKEIDSTIIHEVIWDFTSNVSNTLPLTSRVSPDLLGGPSLSGSPIAGGYVPSSPTTKKSTGGYQYTGGDEKTKSTGGSTQTKYGSGGQPGGSGEVLTISSSNPIDEILFSLPFTHFSIAPEIQTPLHTFASQLTSIGQDPANISPSTFSAVSQPVAEKMQSMMFTPPQAAFDRKILQIHSPVMRVKKNVSVTEKQIGLISKFTLEIAIENEWGVTISKEADEISHSKLVNEYLTPRIAPELDVSQSSNGTFSIGVRQADPKSTMIKVFRRVLPSVNATDSTALVSSNESWEVLLETDMTTSSGEIRFRDDIATTRQLIYRAATYGENNRPAEEFASTIITPRPPKIDIGGTSCSAVANYDPQSTTVTIRLSDLPNKAVSLGVRRYDLTNHSYSKKQAGISKGFVWVSQGSDAGIDTRIKLSDSEEVIFKDSTTSPGLTYNYVPVITTLYGREEFGRPCLLSIPMSLDDDAKIGMTIGTPTILEDGASMSVNFEVGGSFTDFGFNEIKSLLDAGGQSNLFGDQVLENRGQFASLISFVIERENLSTGEIESFGIQEQGTFSDSPTTRQSNNIKDMVPGQRYSYSAKALLNPAETLIKTLDTTEIDTTTLQSFTRNVSKFRGPMQLRKSTLASTQAQVKDNIPSSLGPSNPILQGITAVNKSVDVSLSKQKSYASPLSVEARPDNVTVSWAYSGDLAEIDHFQIYMNSDGGRAFIGTIHNDFTNPNFSYRHFTDGYSQDYSYEVVPIDTRFEEIESIKSVAVPPQMLSKLAPVQVSAAKVIQK